MKLLVVVTLGLSLFAAPASAACFDATFYKRAPSPPTGFFASKPTVPFCLSSYRYSKEHTCSQWDLDSYLDDVADYVEEVQQHYDDVVAFANEATAYANEAVRFSNQAYEYASCEIDEVNTQHE